MRIALVVLEDFPGAENRVQRQALALRDAGHEVRVFAARGASTIRDWHGVTVERSMVRRQKSGSMRRRLFEYIGFSLSAFAWCTRLSVAWKPHVVQFASMPDWLVFCGLPLRLFNRTILALDLHELMPELLDAKNGSSALRKALLALERASVRYADVVFVPTPMCRDILMGRVSCDPLVVINGVDLDRFVFTPSANRGSGVLTVGYHGTLAERFGLSTVVSAIADVIGEGSVALEFVIVGDGDHRATLEQQVRELGLDNVVRFLGQRPSEDIPALASTFDVGVVPYRDLPFMQAAYPTKAFEYAALGVPMICSDLSSMRSLFAHDEVMFASPDDPSSFAEALRSFARQPERQRQKLACNALRRVAAEYSWQVMSAEYVRAVTQSADETASRLKDCVPD